MGHMDVETIKQQASKHLEKVSFSRESSIYQSTRNQTRPKDGTTPVTAGK
jgi:hypothetical protein